MDAALYAEEPVSFPYKGTILSYNKPLDFGYVEFDRPLLEPPPRQMALPLPEVSKEPEGIMAFFTQWACSYSMPLRRLRRGMRVEGRAIRGKRGAYKILTLDLEKTAAAAPRGFWARLWARLAA